MNVVIYMNSTLELIKQTQFLEKFVKPCDEFDIYLIV